MHTKGSLLEGINEVVIDMVKVRQRKRDIVDIFRGGSERRVEEAGVEVPMGVASFCGCEDREGEGK